MVAIQRLSRFHRITSKGFEKPMPKMRQTPCGPICRLGLLMIRAMPLGSIKTDCCTIPCTLRCGWKTGGLVARSVAYADRTSGGHDRNRLADLCAASAANARGDRGGLSSDEMVVRGRAIAGSNGNATPRTRPSRRAAERFGLSYEGIFRQAGVVKGRNRDTAWFAAIDGEWPALRAAFETWLSTRTTSTPRGVRSNV